MITSVRLVNFKNFADETLKVGPFTVIVGANASGKSNIRDAFRFLHGIGRGYTLAEIMGGKYGAGGQLEWTGIRGAMNEVVRFQDPHPHELSIFTVGLTLELGETRASYSIDVERNQSPEFTVLAEELKTGERYIYATRKSSDGSLKQITEGISGEEVEVPETKAALGKFAQALISRQETREFLNGMIALSRPCSPSRDALLGSIARENERPLHPWRNNAG